MAIQENAHQKMHDLKGCAHCPLRNKKEGTEGVVLKATAGHREPRVYVACKGMNKNKFDQQSRLYAVKPFHPHDRHYQQVEALLRAKDPSKDIAEKDILEQVWLVCTQRVRWLGRLKKKTTEQSTDVFLLSHV